MDIHIPASDYTLDVAQFQAGLVALATAETVTPNIADTLAQAATYYRGEFLSDLWQINSVALEEWALLKRAHYHLLALEALETLVDYEIARASLDWRPSTPAAKSRWSRCARARAGS
jgi:hypothetical protein